MSQLLIVSPCPNCGTDASKNNKVLYDGIFLICHNCGYGWYYNIEFIDLSKQATYNSQSKPLSTLHNIPKKPYSKLKNNNHFNPHKDTSPRYISKQKHNNKNHLFSNQDNLFYKSNCDSKKTIPKKKEKSSQPISYHTGQYTSNVYFAPTEHHNIKSTYDSTKHENNYKMSTSSNITSSVPPLSNVSKVYENNVNNNANKNSQKEFNPTESKLSTNSLKSNTTTNIPVYKNIYPKNTVIKVNNLQSHTVSNKSKVNNSVNKVNIITNSSNNYVAKKVSTSNNLLNYSDLNKGINLNSNLSNSDRVTPQNKSSLSLKYIEQDKVLSTKKVETNNSTSIYNNKVQNKDPISPKLRKVDTKPHEDMSLSKVRELEEDFSQSINRFNDSIKNKKQLGLDTNTLIQIDENSQYSTNNTQSPPIKLSNLVPDFKKVCNSAKNIFSTLLHSLVLLFTRLDLLLRFIAYTVIIVGSIVLLVFLNYKHHKKVSQSNMFSSPYNSNVDSLVKSNVKFDKNSNTVGLLVDKNLNSIAPDRTQTIITSSQNHTQDYKNKSYYKESLESIPANSEHTFAKNNIYSQTSNNFKAKIISTLSKSVLALKQAHKNTFSKVKVFQNSVNWKGDHNNSLVSNSTIFNSDSNNSYLIKRLEVTFLGSKGNTIGKRIIVANQLINNYSAIELNLQLNNPPIGTKNVFVSIKDKYKL